jgi:hypothetical protein
VVGDRVIISGGPTGSLFPSGSSTTLSHGRVAGRCDTATVQPDTLRLGRVRLANCGDPALHGEQVLAVSYLEKPASSTNGVGAFAIRIAHVDRSAPDGYTLGPVVMTYQECSDCSAQWIYGDGSLWLYGHGELLRVSAISGKVARRWTIPPNPRELLAVDAGGLWFAPSVEGGWPIHTPASQLIRYKSLYRVTPGAKNPARVFKLPFGNALWLVAAGHAVWLESHDTHGMHGRSELWRLQGPRAKPTYLGSYPENTEQGGDIGEAQLTRAGNAAIGIYFVSNPGTSSPSATGQEIINLSPNAAMQRTVATIQPRTAIDAYAGPPAVALGNSFYFLDPALLSYQSGDRPRSSRAEASSTASRQDRPCERSRLRRALGRPVPRPRSTPCAVTTQLSSRG